MRLADGPVLIEGLGAIDGGLVDTLGPIEVVGSSIGSCGAEQRRSCTGIVRAKGLDDIVLDERAPGPSVDG